MADYARAERLRELRDATHLSREKVAGEIGVTTKTLFAWENGGKIRWPNAKKLAAFYGVDPEGLVSRELGEAVATVDSDVPLDLQREIRELHRKLDILIEGLGLKPTTLEPTQEATEVVAAIERQHAETAPTAAAKRKPPAARSPRA